LKIQPYSTCFNLFTFFQPASTFFNLVQPASIFFNLIQPVQLFSTLFNPLQPNKSILQDNVRTYARCLMPLHRAQSTGEKGARCPQPEA
jgi:hypothetical protein